VPSCLAPSRSFCLTLNPQPSTLNAVPSCRAPSSSFCPSLSRALPHGRAARNALPEERRLRSIDHGVQTRLEQAHSLRAASRTPVSASPAPSLSLFLPARSQTHPVVPCVACAAPPRERERASERARERRERDNVRVPSPLMSVFVGLFYLCTRSLLTHALCAFRRSPCPSGVLSLSLFSLSSSLSLPPSPSLPLSGDVDGTRGVFRIKGKHSDFP